MTIALARAASRLGYRWALSGSISSNASWAQTLDFPSDDDALDLTGYDVRITFQPANCYYGWDYGWRLHEPNAVVSLSTDDGQITVSDAETIMISASTDDLGALCEEEYIVDIACKSGADVVHLASGRVIVMASLPAWP